MKYEILDDIRVIHLIKLGYDQAQKRITARITFMNNDGINVEKRVSDFNKIKAILDKCSYQEVLPSIIVDKTKSFDTGVIVVDNENKYHKVVYDKDNNKFTEVRLRRSELIDLGIVNIEETINDEETTRVIDSTEEKPEEEKPEEEKFEEEKPKEAKPKEEKTEEEKKERKKTIKNIKIWKKLAALTTAIVLAGGVYEAIKHSNKNTNNNSNNTKYENDISDAGIDTTFNSREQDEFDSNKNNKQEAEYVKYGSTISGEDMASQIQDINDNCFSFAQLALHNIVIDSDKPTIKTINDMRNATLNHKYEVYTLLNEYVKYILEGTTLFNGNVVKAYDYLSPYAKYIVLVSAQSMLQLCPEYDYFTLDGEYNFDSLVDSFDNKIDQTYRELNVQSKKY